MLNKNTLGVKKVRGQSEATCKQAGATKSFDISWGQEYKVAKWQSQSWKISYKLLYVIQGVKSVLIK